MKMQRVFPKAAVVFGDDVFGEKPSLCSVRECSG